MVKELTYTIKINLNILFLLDTSINKYINGIKYLQTCKEDQKKYVLAQYTYIMRAGLL